MRKNLFHFAFILLSAHSSISLTAPYRWLTSIYSNNSENFNNVPNGKSMGNNNISFFRKDGDIHCVFSPKSNNQDHQFELKPIIFEHNDNGTYHRQNELTACSQDNSCTYDFSFRGYNSQRVNISIIPNDYVYFCYSDNYFIDYENIWIDKDGSDWLKEPFNSFMGHLMPDRLMFIPPYWSTFANLGTSNNYNAHLKIEIYSHENTTIEAKINCHYASCLFDTKLEEFALAKGLNTIEYNLNDFCKGDTNSYCSFDISLTSFNQGAIVKITRF